MQVVFIGSGNVATILARRMQRKGYSIKEIYSQDISNATTLADEVGAKAVASLQDITKESDIYILAVSDRAISSIATQVSFPGKLVIHTAGSIPQDVLKAMSDRYGVLYPIQSLRKNMHADTPVPFLIEGNNKDTTKQIEDIAKSISDSVAFGDDTTRLKLHVAAVFACNFTNYMYVQSAAFCAKEGIDFTLLQPLIEETANRLRDNHPSKVFTGPASRGDINTVNKHLSLLQAYPDLYSLYEMISDNIMKAMSRK